MGNTTQADTKQNVSTGGSFDYVKYDELAANIQNEFKVRFLELEQMANGLNPGRAASLVKTKLEEAYMWVGKAIRDNQIARNGSAELQETRKD